VLTVYGAAAVTFMMLTYALERRGPAFVLAFASGCALSSSYGFLAGTWPFGVVEAKGLWVARDVPDRRALVGCFGRAPVHASMILGARYALGTTAAHTERLWTSTGAVLVRDVPPIRYPDERYRTHLMFWDRWAWPADVPEHERQAIDTETAQLLTSAVPAPRVGR